ncbi:MAG: molybdopterin molybdotransferase MoeA [Campylobacter sp.]
MEFISYEKSLEILHQSINAWDKIEKVAITDVLDRNIAYDVVANDNYPSREMAAMDGYAYKWQENLSELEVIDDLPAGSDKQLQILASKCVKTFTGSVMSDGADTLIPIENVEIIGNKAVIKKPVAKGFAVRKIGESYQKGEILIKKGTRLTYAEIALLAELGAFHISVFVKPRVAILSTGSEIKDLGDPLENSAQIHSSNHVAIAAMVHKMGAEPIICPIVCDTKQVIEKSIINAIKFADILITTGGVSVGDYDFVKGVLNEKFKVIINGVAIKPGRHVKVATSGDKYIFALPGFAYSAMVTCALYVRILLNSWLGYSDAKITAVIDEDYQKRSNFLEFTAVNLVNKNGQMHVNLNGKKLGSSAITNNLTNNGALLVIPKEREFLKKGEIVEVIKMV